MHCFQGCCTATATLLLRGVLDAHKTSCRRHRRHCLLTAGCIFYGTKRSQRVRELCLWLVRTCLHNRIGDLVQDGVLTTQLQGSV